MIIKKVEKVKSKVGDKMSEYIPKELVEKAKSLTLLEYLNTYFPEEVVKKSNGTYTTKTHDSLIMSNGLWHRFSNDTGGKSALDYYCKNGYTFKEAVKHILEVMNVNTNIEVSSPFQYEKNADNSRKKEIIIPKRNENNIKSITIQYMNKFCYENFIYGFIFCIG